MKYFGMYIAFAAALLGCKQPHLPPKEGANQSQTDAVARSCVVNGYLAEPACLYSVDELVGLHDVKDIPVRTEGLVLSISGEKFLQPLSRSEVMIKLNPMRDESALEKALASDVSRHVLVFGRYSSGRAAEGGDSMGIIDAYSIKWVTVDGNNGIQSRGAR